MCILTVHYLTVYQAPNTRSMGSHGGMAPPMEHIDSREAALPPPIPVVGKLLVKGKFEFKSVSRILVMYSLQYEQL